MNFNFGNPNGNNSRNGHQREVQFYTEKYVCFGSASVMLMKSRNVVPELWRILWILSEHCVGHRDGHSELVMDVTFREVCKALNSPEVDKIREKLDKPSLPEEERQALMHRWFRLEMCNDEQVDCVEAREEAIDQRVNRLPEAERKAAWAEELNAAQAELNEIEKELPESPEDEAAYQELCEEVAPEVREIFAQFKRETAQEAE